MDSQFNGMWNNIDDFGWFRIYLDENLITFDKQTFNGAYVRILFCTDLFDQAVNNLTIILYLEGDLSRFEFDEDGISFKIYNYNDSINLVYENKYYIPYFEITQKRYEIYDNISVVIDHLWIENGCFTITSTTRFSIIIHDHQTRILIDSSNDTTSSLWIISEQCIEMVTTVPTAVPTAIPTLHDTTTMPTVDPSLYPSTSDPTTIPSNIPRFNTTNKPSGIGINAMATSSIVSTSEHDSADIGLSESGMLIAIGTVCGTILCIFIFIITITWRIKSNDKRRNHELEMAKIHSANNQKQSRIAKPRRILADLSGLPDLRKTNVAPGNRVNAIDSKNADII